jgi:hypothetical protein
VKTLCSNGGITNELRSLFIRLSELHKNLNSLRERLHSNRTSTNSKKSKIRDPLAQKRWAYNPSLFVKLECHESVGEQAMPCRDLTLWKFVVKERYK